VIEIARNSLSLIPDYSQFKKTIFGGYLKKTGDLKLALLKSKINNDQYGYEIYYYARDFSNLKSYLQNEFELITTQQNYITREYLIALANYLQGVTPKDNHWADKAIEFLEEKIEEIPQDARIYATLGKCYAFKGMNDSAIASGEKACDLLPYSFDAHLAPIRKQDLMEILIITGDYEAALEIMEQLLGTPSWLSKGILKLDPIYDKIRDMPRFQELMNDTL
jgi:tetratricopeptide (TPR) repeat protein